jgi:hypothetical protein
MRLPTFAAWQHRGVRTGFEVAFLRATRSGVRLAGHTAAVEGGRAWAVEYEIELDLKRTPARSTSPSSGSSSVTSAHRITGSSVARLHRPPLRARRAARLRRIRARARIPRHRDPRRGRRPTSLATWPPPSRAGRKRIDCFGPRSCDRSHGTRRRATPSSKRTSRHDESDDAAEEHPQQRAGRREQKGSGGGAEGLGGGGSAVLDEGDGGERGEQWCGQTLENGARRRRTRAGVGPVRARRRPSDGRCVRRPHLEPGPALTTSPRTRRRRDLRRW